MVVPYDAAWPERFTSERDRLLALFDAATTRIEHVGSTAVPGLAAKPIIDMLLGVEQIAELEMHIPALESLGWEYLPEHETTFPERRFLARPKPRPRSHHLHAVRIDTPFFREHLAFRDHLRVQAGDTQRYAALKRSLAQRYRNDRLAYTEAKTEFIREVLSRCAPGERPADPVSF